MKKLHLRGEKKPVYFGIELEIQQPPTYSSHLSYTHKVRNYIATEPQYAPLIYGTTPDGGGAEIQFNPMTVGFLNKNRPLMTKFIEGLGALNPVIRSTQAGMHVHIDRAAFTGLSFLRLLKLFTETRELCDAIGDRPDSHGYKFSTTCNFTKSSFDKDLASFRKLSSRLIRPTKTQFLPEIPIFEDHTQIETGRSKQKGKYFSVAHIGICAINRKNLPTVEFRLFNSTVFVDKFYANLQFVLGCQRFVKTSHIDEVTEKNFLKYLSKRPKDYPDLLNFLNNRTRYKVHAEGDSK